MTERRRRTLIFSGAVAALLLLAAAIAERHLKATIEHAMSVRTGRPVRIGGDLTVHLLSMHPRVSALQVSVGNPPWSPAGEAAEAERVTLLLGGTGGCRRCRYGGWRSSGPTCTWCAMRSGHANWQMYEEGPGHGPPLIHSLSMPDARVELHDARRHLEFNGTVSAADEADDGAAPLLVEGAGQLNGRAASFWVRGDPLSRGAPQPAVPLQPRGALRRDAPARAGRGRNALRPRQATRQLRRARPGHGGRVLPRGSEDAADRAVRTVRRDGAQRHALRVQPPAGARRRERCRGQRQRGRGGRPRPRSRRS